MLILGWDAIADLDLSFYAIRFSSETSGATWANSTTDTEKVPRPATTFSCSFWYIHDKSLR